MRAFVPDFMRMNVALTIAGSDSGAGAGLQADLKTFAALRVYGLSVVTAVTAQNTRGVVASSPMTPQLVGEQLTALTADFSIAAVKTGMLGNAAIVEAVARLLPNAPLVVDPVMISKHGSPLLDDAARHAMVRHLLPFATLVTPNLPEAEALAGCPAGSLKERREAARRIADLGPKSVLIKGGHGKGPAIDLLFHENTFIEFKAPRFKTRHTHGTGCTFSAAIAACLARGVPLVESVAEAKGFITEAIRSNPGLGHGSGPVNHHAISVE